MKISKILFVAATTLAMSAPAYAEGEDATGEEAPPADDAGGGGATDVGADAGATVGADVGMGGATVDASVSVGMYTKETWPESWNQRPTTLAKGMIEIKADALANLGSDQVFKPFAISPDIYYGVSDTLSVGLTHGLGLCLTGEENGCEKIYNDIGLDALLNLSRNESMDISAHGGLVVSHLSDPLVATLKAGAQIKFVSGKLAIQADPALYIGITERDAALNKEALAIPVTVSFQANQKLNAFARLNIGGISAVAIGDPTGGGAIPLDIDGVGIGDAYMIGLGAGALYAVSNKVDIGGQFLLLALTGGDAIMGTGTDARALVVNANYRM